MTKIWFPNVVWTPDKTIASKLEIIDGKGDFLRTFREFGELVCYNTLFGLDYPLSSYLIVYISILGEGVLDNFLSTIILKQH